MRQASLITPAQANSITESKPSSILLDVRTPAEFGSLHARGARNIPLDDIHATALSGDQALPKDAPVYLLCEKGGRAATAAGHFIAAGFTDVSIVEGGTEAWASSGLPIEGTGRKTISIERQVRIGAGTLVLLGVILGFLIHPAFFALSAFVGAGLIFAGVSDWCGMGLLLARASWNR